MIALRQGDDAGAVGFFLQSLPTQCEHGRRMGIARSLEGLAAAAANRGYPERALRLAGAAGGLRAAMGAPTPRIDREILVNALDRARQALGPEVVSAAWTEGEAAPLAEVIAYALEERSPDAVV